jgi:hypothetical protein
MRADLGVNFFETLQRWQLLDRLPAFFFGQPKLVQALKIQPELRARAEKMSQPQRRLKKPLP